MSTSPTQLETTFRQIHTERMQDVPVVNEKLSVKATEFYPWKEYQLGILITPWFMNIMLLPNDAVADNVVDKQVNTNHSTPSNKESYKVGATKNHVLPSGSYQFVTGYEESIGFFESCSLFSPMFDFTDQETAELTAKEALLALMNKENIDVESQNPSHEIEQIWPGKEPKPEFTMNADGSEISKNSALKKVDKKPRKRLSERLKEPSSRRDFLRGSAFREEATVISKQKGKQKEQKAS
ncbi:MAG: [NiFe]-hydrogenase assembly chaperone HybE [Cocleimonas sp.]|nr:[NiFe]-hydrogenase assembly chaperone HybE [Cocleimonas sp.]